MGKRIVISENEKIKIRKLYGLFEQNIKHLDKVMEKYLNGLDEYYSDIEEYDRVEIQDIYDNDIKPLLREKKLVDMEDIVNYLGYKLDYLNKQKEKKFFSKD